MAAKRYALAAFNASAQSTGSLFTGASDANHGRTAALHTTHLPGRNFDMGIAFSYLTAIYLTTQAPVGDAIQDVAGMPGAAGWSNQVAIALSEQLPNEITSRGRNLQQSAIRDFLALYSVTRNNGSESNGWDDLSQYMKSANNSADRTKILTALFGDGTAAGSIINSVAIGGDPNELIKNPGNYEAALSSKQNPLIRMGEVLRKLGVPNNKAASDPTYNLDAHFNHFHFNMSPPARVEIEALGQNIVAAVTSGAAAGVKNTEKSEYDGVASVCKKVLSARNDADMVTMVNKLYPTATIHSFLFERGIKLAFDEKVKIRVVALPQHGQLVPDAMFPDAVFIYRANVGYLGPDRITFEVEARGKKYKIIESISVQDGWVEDTAPCKTDGSNGSHGDAPNQVGSSEIWDVPSDGLIS
jgi:hypothetical protein